MITKDAIKKSAQAFEEELVLAARSSTEAKALLPQLQPFIDEAKEIGCISDFQFRRLRFDHPFIDGPLADNIKLSDKYANFANLFEGIEV
ncbi:MAG: hypothetical protein ACPF9K_04575 [Neptuniibacter sp.]